MSLSDKSEYKTPLRLDPYKDDVQLFKMYLGSREDSHVEVRVSPYKIHKAQLS